MVKLDRAAAAFRRKILEIMMCGGKSVNSRQKRSDIAQRETLEPKVKSERLVELILAAEDSDFESDTEEMDGVETATHCEGNGEGKEEETRRKMEFFEGERKEKEARQKMEFFEGERKEETRRKMEVSERERNEEARREMEVSERERNKEETRRGMEISERERNEETRREMEVSERERNKEETRQKMEGFERERKEEGTRRKIESFEEFKRVASVLHSDGNGDQKREAAMEIRQLAKGDVEARETLAMLGAIPPLIGMLDPKSDLESQIAALYAILNLGVGNDLNKAAIVKAGAVHKMLALSVANSSILEAIVANFLSLSALDSNKHIIGSSGVIPFLLTSFRENPNCKIDALRAIFNLSILATNSTYLLESGIMAALLSTIGESNEITNHALATISNLVSSSAEARKVLSGENESFSILIDALSWTDCPSCQEKSVYILMIMAHKSRNDRAVMAEAGIASALLELTLLGTPLAQKRACRILEILREKKEKEISAPMKIQNTKGKEKVFEEDERGLSDEKKAVKRLVQQSLQCNLRRIAKRANLPEEILPLEHVNKSKTLVVSSTSKSLPF